jgi:SNF family Na+-dependent transporter
MVTIGLLALVVTSFIVLSLSLKYIKEKEEWERDKTIWWVCIRPIVVMLVYIFAKSMNILLTDD